MSRRTIQWKKRIIQAQGTIDKIIPTHVVGSGMYLTKHEIENRMYQPQEGGSKKVCSLPMTTAKEQRMRQLATKMYR